MQLKEIKKLADLARIDIEEKELKEIAEDFGSILAYVGQVQEISKLNEKSLNKQPKDYFLHNVMRDDIAINKRGEYTEKIVKEMPNTEDGFLKVKQIL